MQFELQLLQWDVCPVRLSAASAGVTCRLRQRTIPGLVPFGNTLHSDLTVAMTVLKTDRHPGLGQSSHWPSEREDGE